MYIFDQNLTQIGAIGASGSASPIGVAYSPTSDLTYLAWYDSSHVHPAIDVYNTNTLTEVAVVDAGGPFTSSGGGAFGQGSLQVSNDGVLLSSIVSTGVKVYAVAPMTPTEDWYQFTMGNGESATLAIDASGTGSTTLELYDSSSHLLARGTSAANLAQVISDFRAGRGQLLCAGGWQRRHLPPGSYPQRLFRHGAE